MKTEKRAGGLLARKVLLGLATDASVCASIAPLWDGKGFSSRWENLFAGWAIKHYLKYGKPVGRDIGGYYDRWCEKNRDEDVQDAVARLVEAVSSTVKSKQKAGSPEFLIDAAQELLNRTKLDQLREEVQAKIAHGDVDEAMEAVQKFRRVEIGAGAPIQLFKGGSVVKAAFDNISEVLVKWPQPALRQFFGTAFARGEFVCFMAGEKTGKSFMLQEVAYQAITQGNNVAFFEVGDQTKSQIIRRFAARAAERPSKADTGFKMPTGLVPGDAGDAPKLSYKVRRYEKEMTAGEAHTAFKALGKKHGSDSLQLSVHPNSSITALQIGHILQEWARDGWVADVVVVDYSDILAPLNGSAETRDQINATWKALRGLGQKLDCCMVTATQADAASYKAHTLGRTNFSEDKRKYAHVTAMFGINRTEAEYDQGLMRLNCILARDLEFSSERCVFVAPCFAVANPCVFSCF